MGVRGLASGSVKAIKLFQMSPHAYLNVFQILKTATKNIRPPDGVIGGLKFYCDYIYVLCYVFVSYPQISLQNMWQVLLS